MTGTPVGSSATSSTVGGCTRATMAAPPSAEAASGATVAPASPEVVVREAGRRSRPGLDHHLDPGAGQLGGHLGHDRHPILARARLFDDGEFHGQRYTGKCGRTTTPGRIRPPVGPTGGRPAGTTHPLLGQGLFQPGSDRRRPDGSAECVGSAPDAATRPAGRLGDSPRRVAVRRAAPRVGPVRRHGSSVEPGTSSTRSSPVHRSPAVRAPSAGLRQRRPVDDLGPASDGHRVTVEGDQHRPRGVGRPTRVLARRTRELGHFGPPAKATASSLDIGREKKNPGRRRH